MDRGDRVCIGVDEWFARDTVFVRDDNLTRAQSLRQDHGDKAHMDESEDVQRRRVLPLYREQWSKK